MCHNEGGVVGDINKIDATIHHVEWYIRTTKMELKEDLI